jgi:putative acetyltransferase
MSGRRIEIAGIADMTIALESAKQPDVVALIEDLDKYQKPLYPLESFHGIDINALTAPNVLLAVARDEAGAAIGCGAIVIEPQYGELKRMYVVPTYRGNGIGRAVLQRLETEAATRGCSLLMLETGPLQPEALALYQRAGYTQRGPFGAYTDDPNSVYMQKITG